MAKALVTMATAGYAGLVFADIAPDPSPPGEDAALALLVVCLSIGLSAILVVVLRAVLNVFRNPSNGDSQWAEDGATEGLWRVRE